MRVVREEGEEGEGDGAGVRRGIGLVVGDEMVRGGILRMAMGTTLSMITSTITSMSTVVRSVDGIEMGIGMVVDGMGGGLRDIGLWVRLVGKGEGGSRGRGGGRMGEGAFG